MTAAHREDALPKLIGVSHQLLGAVALADRYASSALPVLIAGETGTGKELIAQRIHHRSGRRGEMVDINCGSLRPELADSLLFGHRRGAFTGAVEATRGLIAEADHGTLFLDELSALPLDTQATLLRVIETHQVRQLGGAKRYVDFRLVAAVQPDLGARVAAGRFRADLYQRIAGVVIQLSPLRERRDDIPMLAMHFSSQHGCTLGPGVGSLLKAQHWAHNIRQLRAVIDRAAVGAPGSVIDASAVREALGQSAGLEASRPARAIRVPEEHEARHLVEACIAARWNIKLAGEMVGLRRATMYRRLADHGIVLRRSGGHLSRSEIETD